ncbi:S24/S26 family peptidase [Halosegnis longus]|uniref:S26 family signal peptidase n=1 Tax=Halosegnis longus TaxID=2216012 RepID=A0AAJ4RA50_9EURY|nr:S26 family signal peptidase [Salella cibi]
MSLSRRLRILAAALVALMVASLFVGQLLGQPILLGFVETGSMSPTLEPGDGFVAIPAAVAGPIEQGDVVTFRATTVGGGGLTTHRVVDIQNGQYTTKGDANPFVDQASGEPPVTRARIVAVAPKVGGSVVVIPELGTVAAGSQQMLDTAARPVSRATGLPVAAARGLVTVGLVVGLALAVTSEGTGPPARETDRDVGVSRHRLTQVTAAAVVVAVTAAMVLPGGAVAFEIVSAEQDAPGPRVIEQGETETANYTVSNGGIVPVVSYLSGSDRASVADERVVTGSRSQSQTTVRLSAPAETGLYRTTVTERRYLALLPLGLIDRLHAIHPVLPLVVIDLWIGALVYGLLRIGLGTGRTRQRRIDRPRALAGRLRRYL